MNAVIVAVIVMVGLSLMRVSVVLSLVIGAVAGGLSGGLSLQETIQAFNEGLGGGAKVALSYALLGAFAVAISRSGLPDLLADAIIRRLGQEAAPQRRNGVKYGLLTLFLLVAISSQNLIPIHIAFIPILVPPLLKALNRLQIDRRLVATVLTFGLTAPYMLLPVGFGAIFLNDILLANLRASGLEVAQELVPQAMAIPVLGMVAGLLVAVFFSYRKPRIYQEVELAAAPSAVPQASLQTVLLPLLAIVAALVAQLSTDSIIAGALAGIILFSLSGVVRRHEADDLFTNGMRMMALIGFIMIAAAGFASVVKATGHVDALVSASTELIGPNKGLAALIMLLVGLLITMGIGSSFSTIPIITALYVPMAMQFGFSPLAIVALVGTAAALGDAGSPASDSTLGPTSGLNVDGQHNHMWDSVVPTFIHYNIPLIIFGWVAAMTL